MIIYAQLYIYVAKILCVTSMHPHVKCDKAGCMPGDDLLRQESKIPHRFAQVNQ